MGLFFTMASKPTHWADIQEKAFTRWCNNHLEDRGRCINDFRTDWKDGLNLIALLEIFTFPKTMPRYNKHPRIPIQKTENIQIALDFLKNEGIKLVNIGPSDIEKGSVKLTLGLIWTIIYHYQICKGGDDLDYAKAKNALLEWVRSKIPEYDIQNFKKDWNDGRALCALNNAIANGCCSDHQSLDSSKGIENCARGIHLGEENFGIKPVLAPNEMNNPRVDEKAMITYISEYRDAVPQEEVHPSRLCRAYGQGLIEGTSGKVAPFTIEIPPDCDLPLEVKVIGPANSSLPPTLTKTGNGTYECSYNPDVAGDYEIHVTLGGQHIPGSIFKVTVLAEISLGGEGKIIVFFSTTSSSAKGRRDVFDLQALLERKEVHKRPDFEPWIPVDILEREDREAVFEKAGTRNLPIVYVDDKYIGDYDTIYNLEEQGKLNDLLNYRK